jgi:ATP-dependent Lon protease
MPSQSPPCRKSATRSEPAHHATRLGAGVSPSSREKKTGVPLDLSEVSYIATANSLDPLPGPLRERFRVVEFPKPRAADLKAMLPAILADLVRERGLDGRWVQPIDDVEYTAVARAWRGGSVRRLRRILEPILRHRGHQATRN